VTGQPPGDYLLFVHLVDETGTLVAQRDTHPGLGNFPSRQWQPGDRFIESIRLYVPETAYTPATATLSVGLYAPGAYRLGITGPDGRGLGDALTLGTVAIEPWSGPYLAAADYPNPLDQNFNNEVRLVGYEYDQREVQAGEQFTVTLFWQAGRQVVTDYIVQVHLLDEMGSVRATADSRLQQEHSPTNIWQPGQVIPDRHVVPVDASLPSGSYRIHVALLDSVTKEPQNIVAEDGHWIDNHLLLARIRVWP
jgi:hypothetical protein